MITGACHSGAIVDAIAISGQKTRYIAAACTKDQVATSQTRSGSNRIRNSKFSQAFYQSLARIKMPGILQQPANRFGEHETWIALMTYRCISLKHPHGLDTYNSYAEPSDLSKLVEHMIFREKIDVVYDPAVAASRRRIEYPTINGPLWETFRAHGPDNPYPHGNPVKLEVQAIVEFEVAKCDPSFPLACDFAIFEETTFQKAHEPDFTGLLQALYWPGRVQNAVLDVFTMLCERRFLDPECLVAPIHIYSVTTQPVMLGWLLSCFKGPYMERKIDPPFKYHHNLFELPIT